MAARLVLFCGAVAVAIVPAAWASDAVESGAPMETSAAVAAAATSGLNTSLVDSTTPRVCKPTISSKILVKNRRKISDAFEVAVEQVQEVPECRELFANLGADGIEALDMVVFLPIGRAQARGGVCSGTSAYTLVGGGPIWVCRDFSRLSDIQAAMVIIHEALHHAGLSEYPQDADGMTSTIINQMVMKQCGL